MFGFGAQNGPQTGNQYTTNAIMNQNNGLLGNPQIQQATNLPNFNTTAPGSMGNPAVANMIKALQGGK
jgi:hypothetical protein